MPLQYCSNCLNPSSRPQLHFSDEGVCSACLNYSGRASVDWVKRKEFFLALVEKYKSKNCDRYDCVVGVSGGKDSTYQILTLLRYGLRALAVTGINCALSDIGRKNLNNLSKLGVDRIEVATNQKVRAAMNRHALRTVGDISWPEHAIIASAPLQISAQMGIPLQIWGENSANEYGGQPDDENAGVRPYKWTDAQLNGLSLDDFIGIDGITRQDLIPYSLPARELIEQAGITGVFLGYYFPWDGLRNAIISQAHGMVTHSQTIEGSMVNYENLDNFHTGIHDYFMYLKYGFGRTTTLVNLYIRRGRLSREEGAEIVAIHDGRFPVSYLGRTLKDILDDINMDYDEFCAICDKFTNKDIFLTDSQGRFIKRKDGSPQLITV